MIQEEQKAGKNRIWELKGRCCGKKRIGGKEKNKGGAQQLKGGEQKWTERRY